MTFMTGVSSVTSMKYSTDALDDTLYEAGEPVFKKQPSKKIKVDSNKRPTLNTMQPNEISEYILSTIRKTKNQLSFAEVEDLRPPTSCLLSYESEDSTKLDSCIKTNISDIKNIRRDNNMHILIISSSAIRATELIRQLGQLRQDLGVGKCFAKHFKLEDQLKFFNSKCPSISIGTPNRLSKLFSSGHFYFKLDHVDLCIIDTHRDQKQRNIFEIPETCADLLDFYSSNILPALKSGKTKLIFF